MNKQDCIALDRDDPLGFCAARFQIEPGKIYLDGNSLGALPVASIQAIKQTVEQEWGRDLIASWNTAKWFELPATLGDRIGGLVGAGPGQIVVCDNVSINLYKCLHAAMAMNPNRRRIVAYKSEFPTDLYMIQGAAQFFDHSKEIVLIDSEEDLSRVLGPDVSVAILSQVNFKSGKIQEMNSICNIARKNGVIVIWDLCHSAGALPVELDAVGADFAVGCTYKYLNGGPGSPAFVYVASRHHNQLHQPLSGWWSHANPFDFAEKYQPIDGIKRMLSGTQPILSMRGVDTGLDTFNGVTMQQVQQKSQALCGLFIELVKQHCVEAKIELIGPMDPTKRGSHVSLGFKHGCPLIQAMIKNGVTGDFRPPNIMRFGFAPLYISFCQVWDTVQILKRCLGEAPWNDSSYNQRLSVT